MPKDAREQLINGIPLQRLGTINDIEHAALFLVSPAASYINGKCSSTNYVYLLILLNNY
jgi:3-oxoacyl-[acyl-carrier protein] reductase